MKRPRIRDMVRERAEVHAAIDALYWTFTRCARGKPPAVVRPDLYVRRRELDEAIRAARARNRRR